MRTGTHVRAALTGVAILALAGVVGSACSSDIVFPEQRDPFVYLVLNQTVGLTGEPRQPAFLLTIVRADSVVHRGAERFEMRRLSDGARFDWDKNTLFGPPHFDHGSLPRMQDANWLLADSATGEGLGYPSVAPGYTYELVIESHGAAIRGTTTVPDTFSIAVATRNGHRVAVWPTVDGAAGYAVNAVGDGESLTFQTDTTYRLSPEATALEVKAVDPNAFRYATDEDARRAGIEGGLGVFGAVRGVRKEMSGADPP